MLTPVQKEKLKDFYKHNSGGSFLTLIAAVALGLIGMYYGMK